MSKQYKYSYPKLIGKFYNFSSLLNDKEVLSVFESFEVHWNDEWSKLTTFKKSCVICGNQIEQHLRWTLWNYAKKVFFEDETLNEFDFLSHLENYYYSRFPSKDRSLKNIRHTEQFKNGLILKRKSF